MASVVATASLLAGAEDIPAGVPTSPDGFWPLPAASWLQDDLHLPTAIRLQRVTPDMPAHTLGMTTDDQPLGAGGLTTISATEFVLARYGAAQRGDDRVVFLRHGQREERRLSTFLAWGRWGIDVEDQPLAAPPQLPADLRDAWQALPMRVRRLGAASWTAAAWTDLVRLRVAAGLGEPSPVAGPATQDPYLRRVIAWWTAVSQAHGQLTLTDDADEALFRVTHFPWPVETPVAAGTLALGEASAEAFLLTMAQGHDVTPAQRTAEANRVVAVTIPGCSSATGKYLAQCLAAVIDDDRHGGWPYRSGMVWEADARAQVVTELIGLHDTPLSTVAALGRIGPAVMECDSTQLLDALTTLHHASPWLARQALRVANHTAAFHHHRAWLCGVLITASTPVMTPALRMTYRWLTLLPDHIADPTAELRDPRLLLPLVWRHYSTWDHQQRVGWSSATGLNHLAWGMATDPVALDPLHGEAVARQLVLAKPLGVNAYEADTMAACYGRSSRWDDAIAWEKTALTLLRGDDDLDDEARTRLRTHFEQRIADYHAHRPITEGATVTLTPTTVTTPEGVWSGGLAQGQRGGLWTLRAPTGTVLETLCWRGGASMGPWAAWTAQGRLRWEGYVHDGARIGWWRMAMADGGWATGWYDGKAPGRRCGWWRCYTADGTLQGEGPCAYGRPTAPWRWRQAHDVWTTIAPTTVVLPDEPAAPASSAPAAAPAALDAATNF